MTKAPVIHPDWLAKLESFLRAGARLEDYIEAVHSMETKIMEALAKLEAEVAENSSVVESAITLIEGFSSRLKDAGVDPSKLEALASDLDATTAKLANAVAANTAAEEDIVEEEPVVDTPVPTPPPDEPVSSG